MRSPLIVSGKTATRKLVRSLGFDVVRYPPPDLDPRTRETFELVRPYTLTSPERIAALREAVRHVVRNNIRGSIVECGVWRGGSMMAAARTLLEVSETNRELWLYDTYEGMVNPGDEDRFVNGASAASLLEASNADSFNANVWCRSSLSEVRSNMESTGYPRALINYIRGPVEETIPGQMPAAIAILRLDTDWYASTHHELKHLFPLCQRGGILIIDDYGAWEGARKAVDEYFAGFDRAPMLCRIDLTGRLAVVL